MSLTAEQKKYYTEALRDAAEIVAEATGPGSDPTGTLKAAVFEKIASPLFYAREEIEEQEKEKPKTAISSGVKQGPKTEDREKRIKELKEMGYKPTDDPDIFVFKTAQSTWFTNIRTKESWKGE